MDEKIDFSQVIDDVHLDSIENLVNVLDEDEEFREEIDDIAVGFHDLCS